MWTHRVAHSADFFSAVNLLDVKKGLSELKEGLRRIRDELNEHFSDSGLDDEYSTRMWSFVAKAKTKLDNLTDDFNRADTAFSQAVNFYGEDDRSMSSSEFFGIFKTFVTSYKVRHSPCFRYFVL